MLIKEINITGFFTQEKRTNQWKYSKRLQICCRRKIYVFWKAILTGKMDEIYVIGARLQIHPISKGYFIEIINKICSRWMNLGELKDEYIASDTMEGCEFRISDIKMITIEVSQFEWREKQ